jgi:hypothetical protein
MDVVIDKVVTVIVLELSNASVCDAGSYELGFRAVEHLSTPALVIDCNQGSSVSSNLESCLAPILIIATWLQ